MEKNAIRIIQNEVDSIREGRPDSSFSLTQKKHAAAMRQAKELLSRPDNYSFTIFDSLNCGKLTRLINYIKDGSACLLLWAGYIECVIN